MKDKIDENKKESFITLKIEKVKVKSRAKPKIYFDWRQHRLSNIN